MDPVVGMIGAALFGFFALVWTLGAAIVWLGYRRAPRLAGGAPLACGAVSLAFLLAMPPGYSRGEHERVKRLHAEFAPRLEAYRQAHGEYPPTLEAAGIETPRTRYGPLDYTAARWRDGQPYYAVGFGNYFDNGFTAAWDSRSRKWYIDT